MQSLFAFLCVVAGALAADNFKYCETSVVKVTAVKVNGQDKCELKSGRREQMEISFEPTEDIQQQAVPVYITSYYGDEALEEYIDESDACQEGGLECPLVKGKPYIYRRKMTLLGTTAEMEKIDKMIEFKKGDDNDVLMCIIVPCVIV